MPVRDFNLAVARYKPTRRKLCDCGQLAPYEVDVECGPPHYVFQMSLCPACYIIHLEMELDALIGDRSHRRGRLSAVNSTALSRVIRRYVRLERANTDIGNRQRQAQIQEAFDLLQTDHKAQT